MEKNKLFLILFAFFTVLNTVNAQIENEIKSFVDSTELLVNNGRRMLSQYVQIKDYQKVTEIYDFLNKKTLDKNCSPFIYSEDLYIAILTDNWDDFLASAEHYSEEMKKTLCYPVRDQILVRTLYLELKNNASQLLENAQTANLTLEEKELFELYFHLIENKQDDVYDKKLKDFKKKYPKSQYNDFVNNYLPKPAIKTAFAFSFGATQIFPTKNLDNYFASATTGGLSVDFYSNKFFFGLQFNAGGMKFKTPLLSSTSGYDKDFQKGDRLTYIDGGLLGGYSLLKNNNLQLSPYVYLGGTTLESNFYKDASDNDLEFKVLNSFFIGSGLRTEVKLFEFETKDRFLGTVVQNKLSLRLDIGYNIPVKYDYAPAGGNILYARIALAWCGGNF